MRKKVISVLVVILCVLLPLSGCFAKPEDHVAAVEDLLSASGENVDAQLDLFWKKVTVQSDWNGQKEKYSKQEYRSCLETIAERRTTYSDFNLMGATKSYVAFSVNVSDFYMQLLEAPAVQYDVICYFKGSKINKIQYIQGPEVRDAQISEYSRGSVGLVMDADGQTVSEVISGSPAEAAGILPGDVILAIDGVDTAGMNTAMDEITYHLKGLEYSTVKMELERNGRRYQVMMQRIADLSD